MTIYTASQPAPAPPSAAIWPAQARAAVSLTYDDAVPTQRKYAAPALEKAGLRGTFFVTGTSTDLAAHGDEWRSIASAGHELASHTLHHPCDCRHDWVPRGYTSQDYDLPRMQAELEQTLELLAALGATRPYTFAYPCGETQLGPTGESYRPLVRQMFLAARGVEPKIANPELEPFDLIPAYDGARSSEELLALVDQAVQQRGWLVLLFHGVGGDHLAVELEAHQRLVEYLALRRNEVWTERFGAVAAHLASRRDAGFGSRGL